MSRMSEPELVEVAALSVEELHAELTCQRAVNTRLRAVIDTQAATRETEVAARDALIVQMRAVIDTQADTHQAELAARDTLVAELRAQVAVLADKVVQLERRVGRDSSSSSRPPSSDSPYTKQPPASRDRSLRGRSGRKPGKQPGAPGVTRSQVADPDELVVCAPDRCQACGGDLGEARVCPACGQTSLGQAPAWASGRAQYGPGAHAHAADLTCANHVPVRRSVGLLASMLGLDASVGWVAGVRGKAAGLLEPFMEHVVVLLRQAKVLHVDETPARAAGGLAYVHVACTEFLTHLHTGGRSAGDIDAGEVLPGYSGTIVRDGYAGYGHLTDALHAWCGAHLLRDLRDVYEFDPDGQVWASSMADLLVYANKADGAARAAGAEAVDAATLAEIVAWYRGTVTTGIVTNQGKRTRTATDARRLARRFAEHE